VAANQNDAIFLLSILYKNYISLYGFVFSLILGYIKYCPTFIKQ